MSLLRALWRLVVMLGALAALGVLLAFTMLAAPLLWVLNRRKPFKPEIPQDLWKGAPKPKHVDWGGHDGT